jgi:RNA polymerase sigma-70 factor, ECF subfamily
MLGHRYPACNPNWALARIIDERLRRPMGLLDGRATVMVPILLFADASGTDADLIERLRRRDPEALADLYDRYGRAVYSLILRVVRDTAIAEDLVQETFLRVWNRVHGLDGERGSLGAWLMTVARNRAIDYLRSTAGRERNALELDETDHPALYRDIEPDILNADKTRRVRAAMEKLSPNLRTVMELAYFEGLSQTEMAERIGQPLGTVKTWVRTALKSLRAELGVAVAP